MLLRAGNTGHAHRVKIVQLHTANQFLTRWLSSNKLEAQASCAMETVTGGASARGQGYQKVSLHTGGKKIALYLEGRGVVHVETGNQGLCGGIKD